MTRGGGGLRQMVTNGDKGGGGSKIEIFTLTYFLNGPKGSLVIALVRWSVRDPSLNISETAHWFFLIFCIKLEHHKGTKMTEPDS